MTAFGSVAGKLKWLAATPDGWGDGPRAAAAAFPGNRESMSMDHAPACPAYGFLTTVESPIHGLFGGYLLVDPAGRPLEFHCTAPVKVSRAQQILYGATLDGHLRGRQIGATLIGEGTVTPLVVLTDDESMLAVQPHTDLPVALVTGSDAGTGLEFGAAWVRPPAGDAAAAATLRDRLAPLAATVDLREPFERIRAALEEAQKH